MKNMKNTVAFSCVLVVCFVLLTYLALSKNAEAEALQKAARELMTLEMNPQTIKPFTLSPEEWRKRLTPEQYKILRDEGTERAHTSPLNDEKRAGYFVCAGCGLALFHSRTKYESHTGWPSFWEVILGRVKTSLDFKLIIPRTEYHCSRCGGHQGHVFKDGPKDKGGLRYCNNGLALKFVPQEE